MGTISLPQGRGNLAHNIRSYGEDKMPSNIDVSRMQENVIIHHETLHAAYHRLFDEPVEEYNNKQKRADRKIKDYYQHVKNSKNGEKLFYEDVLQWGKKEDFEKNPELRQVAKSCLIDYIKGSKEVGVPSFAERNPGLEIIGAYIHMDEASPHMHFDYIPVASGYKTGLQMRNSLDRTMKAVIKHRTGREYSPRAGEVDGKGKCIDNATKQWKELERELFRSICISHGLVVDAEIATPERDSLSVVEYKREVKEKEVLELEKTAEELRGEIMTTEEIYNIDIRKPLILQNVKLPYVQLADLIATAGRVDQAETEASDAKEDAKKQIEEANRRADEGVNAANIRADLAIEEENKRADKAIEEANARADKVIEEANARADKAIEEAKAIKKESEDIIANRDSIIKDAMDKAKSIIQEAIDSVPAKTKEAFNNLKKIIKELTNKKKDLEEEIEAKSDLGERILLDKRIEAGRLKSQAEDMSKSILENANNEADKIREKATANAKSVIDNANTEAKGILKKANEEANKLMEEAIKNSGADGIMEEISRRLGIVSRKEVADAKKEVIKAYDRFRKYDEDGAVGRSIDEGRTDLIDELFRKSTVYNDNYTIKRREAWHDEILSLSIAMDKYLEINNKPHSIQDVLDDIQATENHHVIRRHR